MRINSDRHCEEATPTWQSKKLEFGLLRLWLAMTVIIVTFASAANAAYDVKQAEQDGVQIWYVEDSILPIISVNIAFKNAGYAHDPKSKMGLAYFVSGMLNEGAGEYSSEEYQKLLDENAIGFVPSVDADNFYISVTTVSENLSLTLDMLNAALTKPKFGATEIARVRSQILSQIKKRDENPNSIAGIELGKTIFGEHPYSNIEEGTKKSVTALNQAAMKKYVKDNFAKDNLVISIAGDVDEEKVQNIVSEILDGLSDNAKSSELEKFAKFPEGEESKTEIKNPQTIIYFVQNGISRGDEDFYGAYLLNHIIGGGSFQSRLYKEVREKRGLTYHIGTSLWSFEQADLWVGTVATTHEKVAETKDLIKQELMKVKQENVSQEELDAARDYILGSFPLNLDKNSKLASYLSTMQIDGLGIDYLSKRNEYFNNVTTRQVNRLARELVAPQALVFIEVGM